MSEVVLFNISPNSVVRFRNFGCYKLACELRKVGITCQVIDFTSDFDQDQLSQILEKFVKTAKVVGFSTTFAVKFNTENLLGDFNLANIEKIVDYANALEIKVVFGGAKVNHAKDLFGKRGSAYFQGYADHSFIEYCKSIIFGTLFDPLLFTSDKTGELYDFKNSSFRFDKSDVIKHGEVLPLEISRGCIFKCKFCASPLTGKKKLDHVRDFKLIRDELIYNFDNFGTHLYIVLDETFNDSVEKMEMFYDAIKDLPFKDYLYFSGYIRHDLLARDFERQIAILDKLNFRYFQYGIETLCWDSGKAIGKGMNPIDTIDFLRRMKHENSRRPPNKKFFQGSGMITGLPNENIEEISENLQIIIDEGLIESLVFTALQIDKKLTFNSEFEKNLSQHGYSKSDKGSIFWIKENKQEVTHSYEAAQEVANNLNKRLLDAGIKPTTPSRIFLMMGILNSYFQFNNNVSILDQIKLHFKESMKSRFLKEYFNALMAI